MSSLQLDELELASLRGLVEAVSVSLNFEKRRGSGRVSVLSPRFSGLQAQSLDAAARWTGDVVSGIASLAMKNAVLPITVVPSLRHRVRVSVSHVVDASCDLAVGSPARDISLCLSSRQVTLERSVLVQDSSRYELIGEYVLPGTRSKPAKGPSTQATGKVSASGASRVSSNASSEGKGSQGGREKEREWAWSGGSRDGDRSGSPEGEAPDEREGPDEGMDRSEAETEAEELLTWAMPPQMHALMRGVGRWRLRLDVPHAEVAELLPAARLLSSSYDPQALLRSKEEFLQSVPMAGIEAESLQQQLEVRASWRCGSCTRTELFLVVTEGQV